MKKKGLIKGFLIVALSMALAVPAYAGYVYGGNNYEAAVHPDTAVGGVYTAQTDEMTTSSFTILKNADGAYQLFIFAASDHSPYVQTFSGSGYLWSSTGMTQTILEFTSDGYLWDTAGEKVHVIFSDNVDFPSLYGIAANDSTGTETFLYDCDYYAYDSICPENNLRVGNCQESITLRVEASTSAAEICQVPLYAGMKYLGTAGGGFIKVSYDGQVGYVLAKYAVPKFQ